MPKIIQINGKVMIKREQRLLAGSAERSNFTESKVNLIKNHVKIKTVSHCPVAALFLFGLGIMLLERRGNYLHSGSSSQFFGNPIAAISTLGWLVSSSFICSFMSLAGEIMSTNHLRMQIS